MSTLETFETGRINRHFNHETEYATIGVHFLLAPCNTHPTSKAETAAPPVPVHVFRKGIGSTIINNNNKREIFMKPEPVT